MVVEGKPTLQLDREWIVDRATTYLEGEAPG